MEARRKQIAHAPVVRSNKSLPAAIIAKRSSVDELEMKEIYEPTEQTTDLSRVPPIPKSYKTTKDHISSQNKVKRPAPGPEAGLSHGGNDITMKKTRDNYFAGSSSVDRSFFSERLQRHRQNFVNTNIPSVPKRSQELPKPARINGMHDRNPQHQTNGSSHPSSKIITSSYHVDKITGPRKDSSIENRNTTKIEPSRSETQGDSRVQQSQLRIDDQQILQKFKILPCIVLLEILQKDNTNTTPSLLESEEKNTNAIQTYTVLESEEKNTNTIPTHSVLESEEKKTNTIQSYSVLESEEKNTNTTQSYSVLESEEKKPVKDFWLPFVDEELDYDG